MCGIPWLKSLFFEQKTSVRHFAAWGAHALSSQFILSTSQPGQQMRAHDIQLLGEQVEAANGL